MRSARLLHIYPDFPASPTVLTARGLALIQHFGARAEHVLLSITPVEPTARKLIKPRIKFEIAQSAQPVSGGLSIARYKALADYLRSFHLVLSHQSETLDVALARTLFAGQMRLPPVIHHEHGLPSDERQSIRAFRNWYRILALARTEALVVPNSVLVDTARTDWKQPPGRVRLIIDPLSDIEQPLVQPGSGASRKRTDRDICADYMALYGRAMRRRDFGEWDE